MDKKTIFSEYYSPYSRTGKESVEELYEWYLKDPNKIKKLNGYKYRRILSRCFFCPNKERRILIQYDPEEQLKLGNVLLDEKDREYVILAFEMFRIGRM